MPAKLYNVHLIIIQFAILFWLSHPLSRSCKGSVLGSPAHPDLSGSLFSFFQIFPLLKNSVFLSGLWGLIPPPLNVYNNKEKLFFVCVFPKPGL